MNTVYTTKSMEHAETKSMYNLFKTHGEDRAICICGSGFKAYIAFTGLTDTELKEIQKYENKGE